MLFLKTPLKGNLLPAKTLCLTYDDGPGLTTAPMPAAGPRTDDLGFYLFLQGIPATFFVIGQRAASEPQLCLQLMQWGHLVANHTETHNGLPWESPALMIADVVNASGSIGAATNPNSLLLRPPYAAWSDAVGIALNSDANARKHTGPIMFDIGANDWQFWDDPTKTPTDCANDYYNQTVAAGSGIMVMHDCAPSFDPPRVNANQTYELTRILIPRLLADGYRFIRLDAVPQIRSAMLVSSLIALKSPSGYVSPQNGGGGAIFADGPASGPWEELGVVQIGNGKQAIRAPNGQFMSTQPNGEVLANGDGIYGWEEFQLIQQTNGTVAIQAYTGKYVSAQNAGQIIATATSVTTQEQFTLESIA